MVGILMYLRGTHKTTRLGWCRPITCEERIIQVALQCRHILVHYFVLVVRQTGLDALHDPAMQPSCVFFEPRLIGLRHPLAGVNGTDVPSLYTYTQNFFSSESIRT